MMLSGLSLLNTAVALLNKEGRVVYANSAFEQLLHTSAKHIEGQKFTEITGLHGLASMLSELSSLHLTLEQTGTLKQIWYLSWDTQGAILSPSPTFQALPIDVTLSKLDGDTDKSQDHFAYCCELHVFDMQNRYQQDVQHAQQTEMTRQLVRNMAHEIKNPLGGIRGSAQLLAEELQEHPYLQNISSDDTTLSIRDLNEYTKIIIREADRLQHLVDRLLEPNQHPIVLEVLSIHEVCERVRQIVLAEYPNTLNIIRDYDASIPEIEADKTQLIQALLNITKNAAQAMQGHGNIVFRTRIQRQILLAKKRVKLALELLIQDDGPGIPDNLIEHIFFPLVTGKAEGTGLGLSLAQSFIHQHEGLIDCESQPGKTTFRILLPLYR